MTGKTLGNYEVLEKLGEGGMGEVWRGRDKRLQRYVAIKVLPPDVASDASRRARFEQEARALGALNHPNIVSIYDFGEDDGRAYIVSELVEGESLRAIISRGPMTLRKTIDVAVQVADGVAAAHSLAIVHRDLKPENVMVTPSGQVKVLDFGLAKQSGPPEKGDQTATMALSMPGMVMGTAGYMSPEQVRAEAVDARSDIFSLGCILYEMATGKRAFEAPTGVETMSAILNSEPAELEADQSKLPPALTSIVRRCLEKRREQRFQSAADLAFALRAIGTATTMTSSQAAAVAAAKPPRRLWIWPAALVAAVALVAAGMYVRGLVSAKAPVKYQRISFRRGFITNARFTADGSNVIYSAAFDDGPEHTYLAVPGKPVSRDLQWPDGARIAAISSKQDVAILEGRKLIVTSLSGGEMRPLLEDVIAVDWSPNGSELAVLRNTKTGYQLEYPIGNVLVGGMVYVQPMIRVAPDGEHVAFAQYTEGSSIGIFIADRKAGKGKTHSLGTVSGQNTAGQDSELAWTPAGDEILFHSFDTVEPGTVYAIDMKGRRRVALELPSWVHLYDMAKDGRALLSNGIFQLGILARQPGDDKERDLSCLDSGMAHAISADGKTIVANVVGESGGPRGSIYIRKMDGSVPVRVGDGFAFGVSPDARWISGFVQDDKGFKKFLLMPTGPGEVTETRAPGLELTIVIGFLGEDQFLVDGTDGKDGFRCYVWDSAKGTVRPVCAPSPTEMFLLSPDKQSVLSRGKDNALKIFPIDGSAPQSAHGIERDEFVLAWGPDSRSVYVQPSNRENKKIIPVTQVDLATGKRTPWKEIRPAMPVMEAGDLVIAPTGAYAYTYVLSTSDLYVATGLK